MRRGPKPKPTQLKLLTGTRKDRINQAEPPVPPGRPAPPDHLDGLALEKWNELIPILEGMRVLTVADGGALALLCNTHSRWIRARADVARRGMILETPRKRITGKGADRVVEEWVVVKTNPAVYVVQQCEGMLARLHDMLGLTPSGRSRIKAEGPAPQDKLAEFLSRSKG